MTADVRPRSQGISDAALAALFTATVCANAALLFAVEPMFAKLALPLLGGTPSVWNTALVFYQAMLLLGYGYAHASTRWLPARGQLLAHGALFTLSLVALPLQLRFGGDPPGGASAISWLIAVFTVSLGLPFAVLSAGAPLLQRWFAASDHRNATDPYFLYAASNVGSLCALLAYPLLIEPNLSLGDQRRSWSVGYVVVLPLVLLCALIAARRRGGDTQTVRQARAVMQGDQNPSAHGSPVTRVERARWMLYAAVPSSLLLGVTSYVTTDIAAIPLLWVIPLALYLLTFVFTFSGRGSLTHGWMVRVEPYFLILVSLLMCWQATLPGQLPILLHFGLLFVVSMVCHGELARRRPSARHLTEFFLWISVGGLVGGIFNALLAPLLFSGVAEYPIALVLAGALRPDIDRSTGSATVPARVLDVVIPVALGVVLIASTRVGAVSIGGLEIINAVAVMLASMVMLSTAGRPLRFSAALAAVFLAGALSRRNDSDGVVVHAARSYFGTYRVRQFGRDSTRELIHGTTLHGAQSLTNARRLEPRTYYSAGGPIGDVFAMTAAGTDSKREVGVVGLGIGSLSCYGRVGERWTFFEIDPVVVELASDAKLFTFLRDCPPTVDIRVGDARLTLRDIKSGSFDVLVVDAFSSDAIPVHLMTREAFALYDRVLAPHGLLAVHISNQHVDLEPIVSSLARQAGLFALIRRDVAADPSRAAKGQSPSIWVVLSRDVSDVGVLASDPRWGPPRDGGDVWTDDFSNVLHALSWR